jgi:hypothetical protein
LGFCLFLIDFFYFIPQYLVGCGLYFVAFFDLMRLYRSHDLNRKFNRLTQVDLDDWELIFLIFILLLSIKLSRCHDLSHGFTDLPGLTWVTFLSLFNWYFFFIIQYWVDSKLSFVIYLDLLFIILFLWPKSWNLQVNQGRLNRSNMSSS